MAIISSLIFPLTLALCVNAQTYYRRRRGLAGRIIAGIVVAVVGGLLLCMLLSLFCIRRRRRSMAVLPGPGSISTAPHHGQGVAHVNNYQQPGYNQTHQPPAGAPPNFQGHKEGYQGQNDTFAGGFAPPLGPPPAAHVHDNHAFKAHQ